jgi:hypothetical protein
VLALHLLQAALVHVNTLLLQKILAEPGWSERMTGEDLRALSPLFWAHVSPYGRFVMDMDSRLDFAPDAKAEAAPEDLSSRAPLRPSESVSSGPI